MRTYLYKLKQGYVLCSDEEQKEGDCIIHKTLLEKITRCPDKYGSTQEHWYKVLTQSPDFSELSEEDAKRIGWFDVEGLAYRHRRSYQDSFEGMNECIMNDAIHQQRGYVAGFQKHAELTADRRFTEDDVIKAFNDGMKNAWKTISEKILPEEYIKSLSQPKSWEVEYKEENGVYKVTKIL